MAIRAPVAFVSTREEGCVSDHEVPDEEQEEKAFCRRHTPLSQA
ncbi:MAG: hypothetical protein K0Q80_1946 [Microvirga sp.]|nr:hypothetical protein [Microvirga sp.]